MTAAQILDNLAPYTGYYAILAVWVSVISVLSIAVCIWDKAASKTGKVSLRIPEKVLFTTFPLLGGSLAMLLTMLLIHHKTKHWQMLFIPVILVLQLAALIGVTAIVALGIV